MTEKDTENEVTDESVYYEDKECCEKFKSCCAESYHPYKKVSSSAGNCVIDFLRSDSIAQMDPILPIELHFARHRRWSDNSLHVNPPMSRLL